MKITELFEGMTFHPVVEKEITTGEYKGETYWTSSPWQREIPIDCRDCEGTGKDNRGYSCVYCHGTGKETETVSDAPELDVSNANGRAIQEMLGLDPDYSGVIEHRDLPAVMRKLILLKNKSSSQFTQDPSVETGSMGQTTSQDTNITHIGRQGPTMLNMGRSQSQVDGYIDELIKIVKFAQENNASLGWG